MEIDTASDIAMRGTVALVHTLQDLFTCLHAPPPHLRVQLTRLVIESANTQYTPNHFHDGTL